MPREKMHELSRRVGFGVAPHLGFPGEASGKLSPAKSAHLVKRATTAYGRGISVIQFPLSHAYTVFARDGELVPLSLVSTATSAAGTRVLSHEVAREMRAMLESAVQPG